MNLTQVGRWPSPWPSLEIFYGRGLCALLMLWGLGGEVDATDCRNYNLLMGYPVLSKLARCSHSLVPSAGHMELNR